MNPDKEKAIELRRSGKSYSDINKNLGIPKSTLATWFKNEEWSIEIRDRLGREQSLAFPKKLEALIRANKERWAKTRQNYRDQAKIEFAKLKDNPLFIAGLMLYWGEGDKGRKGSQVKLANTDPIMIRIFYSFLKDIIAVPADKINIWLLLYPDLIDRVQKNFWSKATGIPLSQFKNSIYIQGRHPTKRLSYGVCNIYVSSREFKEKILTWLDLSQKILIQ